MIFEDILRTSAFIVLYIIIFLLSRWLKDVLTPYRLNQELVKNDNFAVSLSTCGYYLAVAIIFLGVLYGPSNDLLTDLSLVGGYSVLGLFMLNVSRWFNDNFILRKFCDTEQLVKKHNLGVGAVHFGTYVATGMIVAGALLGQGGNFLSALVFFVLGQLSLFLFSYAYDFFTPYDVQQELEKENVAVGVSFGGTLVALGVIVFNGVSGDFTNWKQDLIQFGIVNLIAFLFLIILRFCMSKLLFSGQSLNEEIVSDRNVGAGMLEAMVAISFAAILTQLL